VKRQISAALHSVLPRAIFNALQRARGLPERFPWREFGQMSTCANAKPLFEGKFDELYSRHRTLDPHETSNRWRYRIYNVCYFANLCRQLPGDFVCAGVSWGVAPRIVFDFVDLPALGKTLHLIDPFEGIVANDDARTEKGYNCDPEYVLRQYPPGASVVLHRERIPLRLPGPFAFVFTDTGNPEADAAALPIFYDALAPGGIFITEQYANNIHIYETVIASLGATALWVPSGQGVIVKR
jgi:hypothetical protein